MFKCLTLLNFLNITIDNNFLLLSKGYVLIDKTDQNVLDYLHLILNYLDCSSINSRNKITENNFWEQDFLAVSLRFYVN